MTSASSKDLSDRVPNRPRANGAATAQAVLDERIARNPTDTAACLQLADLIHDEGGFRNCSQPLLHAMEHMPSDISLLLGLVQRLVATGHIVEARRCLDAAIALAGATQESLASQANWRMVLGDIPQGRDLIKQKIRQTDEGDPNDYFAHAMALQFTGDMDGAHAALSECLAKWPDFSHAVPALVDLRRQTEAANVLTFVDERLGRPLTGTDDAAERLASAQYEYARFKILDDLGRPGEAWPALERCNALMRGLYPYDHAAETALLDALVDTVGTDEGTDRAHEVDGPVPIFIVGMPRSGTTLLSRMLSNHSQVSDAGELFDMWNQLHWVADERPAGTEGFRRILRRIGEVDLREVGARYLQQTQWRAKGRSYYIDKLPSNIQKVALIRRALPHAPIINMVREPMDVCFSNFRNFVVPPYDTDAVAHTYRAYRRLCDHWHATMPGSMLDVSYASLVSDPASVMQQVLRHCGLGMEDACLHPELNAEPVYTPSSAQVREPIHDRSLGQWKRYAGPLQPLQEAIADLL